MPLAGQKSNKSHKSNRKYLSYLNDLKDFSPEATKKRILNEILKDFERSDQKERIKERNEI